MTALHDEQHMIAMDREDVIEVIRMRFGHLSEEAAEQLNQITRPEAMQRLILVAANATNIDVFMEELRAGADSFKMLGDRFDPLGPAAGGLV